MTVTIKVDRDRMADMVTVDEYLALLEGDVKTMLDVLSGFVLGDNGAYLEKPEGRKVIGKLTLTELQNVMESFTANAENIAVPPSKGAV